MSKLTLSNSPSERRGGGVRRRVGRGDLHVVGAVGHRRRVPHDDGVPQAALERLPGRVSFAAVEHVGTAGGRRCRLPPSTRTSAAPSGRPCGRARVRSGDGVEPDDELGCDGLRPSDVLSSNPAISSSPVEKGRWKTVPGGCTVMLDTVGPQVARQVGGRHRRQHRSRTSLRPCAIPGGLRRGRRALQRRPPLQVARVRAGDLLAVGDRVGLRPRAPGLVRRRRVARAREDLDLARAARSRASGSRPTSRRCRRRARRTRSCRVAARVDASANTFPGIAGGGDDAARTDRGRATSPAAPRRAPAASRAPDRRTGGRSCPPCRCPTRSEPSVSISRSNGQSSVASHSVSHSPSGRMRIDRALRVARRALLRTTSRSRTSPSWRRRP